MKRFSLVVAIIALTMGLTNPSQKDYLEHIVWDLKKNFCNRKQSNLPTQVSCNTLNTLPPAMTEQILKRYSRRQNYLIFSIYTIDLGGLKNRSIGVWNQFIRMEN